MAGFRDFQTGEILTATNVNDFLMQQSVMKFADAAARDTALGTAVGGGNALREGMVAYLDSTDEVLKYDGTAWASVGQTRGLVAVKTAVTTAVFSASVASRASVDITGLSITHETADPANRVLLFGYLGAVGPGDANRRVGTSFAKDGTFLFTPDSPSNRTGAQSAGREDMISALAYDTPGAGSKVYTMRAINAAQSTFTIYVNRYIDDTNNAERVRAVSMMILMEVAV